MVQSWQRTPPTPETSQTACIVDDVGVIECSGRLRLALEPLKTLLRARKLGWQDLQGYLTLELRVLGAIHHPHPAFAQFGGDLEVGQRLTDQGASILLSVVPSRATSRQQVATLSNSRQQFSDSTAPCRRLSLVLSCCDQ